MTKENGEKFNLGFSKLLMKYQITKAQVMEFASKNPDMMYYTEDALKLVILGLLKLADRLSKKTTKTKPKTTKTCVPKKKI